MTRPLRVHDAPILASLVQENRAFLAPYWPLRSDAYYTVDGQREAINRALKDQEAGSAVPLLIQDRGSHVVGAITLQSIIRGAFQSCSVGFWLAEAAQGQGLASRALREATTIAFIDLRLHRVQAETLTDNVRSQAVLRRVGFAPYGSAPHYMNIAGRWQDHVLYQLLTPDAQQD